MAKRSKVVLAYSADLIHLSSFVAQENYNNCEVIAVSETLVRAQRLDGLEEKAIKTGASKLYIGSYRRVHRGLCISTVQAGAVCKNQYLLGTSFARPGSFAKRISWGSLSKSADAICHGCTGKGNDQVRFELAIRLSLLICR